METLDLKASEPNVGIICILGSPGRINNRIMRCIADIKGDDTEIHGAFLVVENHMQKKMKREMDTKVIPGLEGEVSTLRF